MTTHFESSSTRTKDQKWIRIKARSLMRKAMAELPDYEILNVNLGEGAEFLPTKAELNGPVAISDALLNYAQGYLEGHARVSTAFVALANNFAAGVPIGPAVAFLPEIEVRISKSASLLRKALQYKQGLTAEEVRNVEIALSALSTKKKDECAHLLSEGLRYFGVLGASPEWVAYLSAEFFNEFDRNAIFVKQTYLHVEGIL